MKKMLIGVIFLIVFLGIFLAGCTKEKTYTCSKDSDCALGLRLDSCCSCPRAYPKEEIKANPNIVEYEYGKDYSGLKTVNCKNTSCIPCQPVNKIECIKGKCQAKLQEPTPTVTPSPQPTATPTAEIQTAPTDKISVEPVDKALFSAEYKKEDSGFESKLEQYQLPLDLSKAQNYSDVKEKLGFEDSTLLEQNGFMVFERMKFEDVVSYYKNLENSEVPIFITSDSLLHLYHIQFDETLREIEEEEFFEDITLLSRAMLADSEEKYNSLEGDLKEATRRNAAFFSVGLKLLDPNAQIPSYVQEEANGEIKLIEEHNGMENSPIFIYKEDYSQYVPRGHYTRSEKLKKYFKAMMWYGRMSFLLKGDPEIPIGINCPDCEKGFISEFDAKIQTMQALLIAGSIQNVSIEGRKADEIWERIYNVTSFYVGIADDLTPYEYVDVINKVFGSEAGVEQLEDDAKLLKVKEEIAVLRSPQIFGGTGNCGAVAFGEDLVNQCLAKTKGMRLMGQRFIPDSYIMQNLVALAYTGNAQPFTYKMSQLGPIRGFPRGLDVMAVLGSDRALEIIEEEGDADYVDSDGKTYQEKVAEIKAKFDGISEQEWKKNLYWSWLYSLKALLKDYSEDYPAFMQGTAWKDKQLNAGLGSWAQLRHDTILYAKQSYTPIAKSMPIEPKPVVGYVEPVPEFYARLLALNEMTLKGLKERNALSKKAERRIKSLSEILGKLLALSKRELENEELNQEDYNFIKYFGGKLETAVSGIDVEEGLETTIIADVHTDLNPPAEVLEEGTGYLRTMLVAYKVPDGRILVGAGPVFSYHEFRRLMEDGRLTDEKWKEMLAKGQEPEKLPWISSFYSE